VTRSRRSLIAGVGLAAALVWSAPALAQDAGQDPSPGSPGGTVYEIPLDQGRGDAAPRGGGDGPASGGRSAPAISSIRSADNGTGSTAVVPGIGDPVDAGAAQRAPQHDRDAKPGAVSERGVEPLSPQAQVVASGAGSPSMARSLMLIALGVAIAVGLGIAARRRGRPV
jgi:hypothetical protein